MRSCDSLSRISYAFIPVSRCGTRSISLSTPTSPRAPISQVEHVSRLPPHSRHDYAVAIRSHAADYPFKNGMIAMDLRSWRLRLCGDSRPRLSGRAKLGIKILGINRPKPQRVHHRHRPGTHGENVAQNSADTRRRTLKWLNE